MDERITLPVQLEGPCDIIFNLQHMTEDHVKPLYELFQFFAKKGQGIGLYEYNSIEDFRERFFRQSNPVCVGTATNGDIIFAFNFASSPMSRSTKSAFNSGYMIMNPAYERKGFVAFLYTENIVDKFCKQYGYKGYIGRTNTLNRANLTSRKHLVVLEYSYTARIPCSIQLAGRGWVDDIICFREYSPMTIWDDKVCRTKDILDGSIPTPLSAPLDTWEVCFHPKVIKLPSVQKLSIEVASYNDRRAVEDMIRTAALEGDGFATDEFTPEGHFNYKLFQKHLTIVAKDAHGYVTGAAILGPSNLCRSRRTDTLAGYFIVRKNLRRLGISRALANTSLQFALDNGFKCLLTDVFLTNTAGVQMARAFRLVIVGSVPQCGYVKGHGYVESLLFFKSISHMKSADLPSKL